MSKKFRPEKSETARREITKAELAGNQFFQLGVQQGVILGLREAEKQGTKLEDLAKMHIADFGPNEFTEYHYPTNPPTPSEGNAKTTPPTPKTKEKRVGKGSKSEQK
jgi:hypothetical protein